jgi:YgiT-type zinc finger domain-containing protein
MMRCTVCNSELRETNTSLPFKLSEMTIVIFKDLPVLECVNCTQYLMENSVMRKVDQMLASVNTKAELEIIRYAA